MTHDEEYKGVFDVSGAEGVTASERVLMRLCRKSFLSLWSYANLHTDEGMRDGKGSTKEFVDVLAMFGDDIILFSDKHVTFNEHKTIDVAWRRWYEHAVEASAKQLYGALNWLRRYPDRLFLDAQCKRRLPLILPPPERVRYHLVAVTRGTLEACSRQFPGSIGTLQIKTDIEGNVHWQTPFTIGIVHRGKPFVHVLDEFSLEVVLGELDTATDFVTYLRVREDFLSDPATTVFAAGEEQLVAAYLVNGEGEKHSFIPRQEGAKPDLVWFDESHYSGLKSRNEYQGKKRADQKSHFWDEMIERFIKLGDPKTIHPEFQQDNSETEQALRLMASEGRFRRRVLVESFEGCVLAAQQTPGKRRARIVTSEQRPGLVYIFLIVPKTTEKTYEEYQQHRVALLNAYCRCAKLRFPEGNTFVGIGFDHPVKDYQGGSEVLCVYTCEELTEEDRSEAERYREELGILGDGLTMHESHADEYPRPPADAARAPISISQRETPSAKAKRRARVAQASRRRNRR